MLVDMYVRNPLPTPERFHNPPVRIHKSHWEATNLELEEAWELWLDQVHKTCIVRRVNA
jgi:hypothetical protein